MESSKWLHRKKTRELNPEPGDHNYVYHMNNQCRNFYLVRAYDYLM